MGIATTKQQRWTIPDLDVLMDILSPSNSVSDLSKPPYGLKNDLILSFQVLNSILLNGGG